MYNEKITNKMQTFINKIIKKYKSNQIATFSSIKEVNKASVI